MGAAAFIMAEFLGMAYSDVVIAAFIPAFCLFCINLYSSFRSFKVRDLKGMKKEKKKKWKTFVQGIHYLIPIFLTLHFIVLRQSVG